MLLNICTVLPHNLGGLLDEQKKSICCGNTLHAVRAENLLIIPSIRDVNDMLLNIAIMPFNTCLSLVYPYAPKIPYTGAQFSLVLLHSLFVHSLSLIWI